jgi:hypothetical protein
MVYDPIKRKEYYEKNKHRDKEKVKERQTQYREDLNKHVIDSITAGEILDQHKWDVWCNYIKSGAKTKQKPYSADFTNYTIFKMMLKGCFYCGDIATTIDRLDSSLDHKPENCVGS